MTLLAPPAAFLIYALLVGLVLWLSSRLAPRSRADGPHTSVYASGEQLSSRPASPGYQPFFAVALFFAVLHLGALMIGSGDLSPSTAVYIGGLIIALLALILG
ncbi:MAG: hypothetical protein GYB64_07295 [Chloroflexi bacterium]|nr:hypothetical protein [Chloroflexota bacterium]